MPSPPARRYSGAQLPTSKLPPVISTISVIHADAERYYLELVTKCRRETLLVRGWTFQLDPGGELPCDVAADLWECVNRPLAALRRYEETPLF